MRDLAEYGAISRRILNQFVKAEAERRMIQQLMELVGTLVPKLRAKSLAQQRSPLRTGFGVRARYKILLFLLRYGNFIRLSGLSGTSS